MPFVDPPQDFAHPPRVADPRAQLDAWDGLTAEGGALTCIEAAEIDATTIDMEASADWEVLDASLTGVTFVASPRSEVALIDSVLVDCDLSRVQFSNLRGCRLVGCKLAGSDLSGRSVRDVSFERCALQYTNHRMGMLERVAFVDCKLDDVDFYNAELTDVTFTGTEFTEVNLDKTVFERVDLRGLVGFGIRGTNDLSGCLVGESQVYAMAYALALATGISIERLPDST